MRTIATLLVLVLAASVCGCAKKTASEQLQEDLKKAGDQLKREANTWK
ncbi:MAG: hypothetical protein MOGMAGMI_01596 [Candidatus Omnitrophica bacterium]|nr:hypothetical protein [Candidatus Omnitrophota bacterium]